MTVRETHCVTPWMQLIYPVNIIHHKNNCGLDLILASAFFDPKTKKNAPLCCFSPRHIDPASCGKHVLLNSQDYDHVMDCHPIQ